jgi:hypothetical protein
MTFAVAIFVVLQPIQVAAASYSNFYTQNNIQLYEPSDSGVCKASTSGGTTQPGSADPAAVKLYDSEIAPKMTRFAPLYQTAAKSAGLSDWQLLAGIHRVESGLSDTNPTGNLAYHGIFQQHDVPQAHIDQGVYTPGKKLSDSDIVTQAEDAINGYLKSKAQAVTVKVDISKPLTAQDAAKLIIAYKSGEGSPWLEGRADPNLHPYAWAGFDTTPQHKLPMKWGPTPSDWGPGVSGDEVAGTVFEGGGLGVLAIWEILKGSVPNGSANCPSQNGGTTSNSTVFYSQHDPRWNSTYSSYIADTYGNAGCYLTSMAMIISTLTGKKVYPTDLADNVSGLASTYGLNVDSINPAPDSSTAPITQAQLDRAIADVQKGMLVLVHGHAGKLFWGSSTHWIVLRGVSNGKLLVNDPADFDPAHPTQPPATGHTNTQWDRSEFTTYATALYGFSKK